MRIEETSEGQVSQRGERGYVAREREGGRESGSISALGETDLEVTDLGWRVRRSIVIEHFPGGRDMG